MSDNDSPLLAIKGRFKANEQKLLGLFLVMINREGGYIESASIVVSVSSDVYELDPSNSWSKYEGAINMLKYKGQYSKTITNDLQETLKGLTMDQDFYDDINDYIKKNSKKGIEHTMGTLISRVMHDHALDVEIHLQALQPEDLESEDAIADRALPDEVAEPSAPAKSKVEINLVIAPVGGKLLSELKPGEKIMVNIIKGNDKAEYAIDKLGLRTDERILPAKASFVSKYDDNGATKVVVDLDESLEGVATLDEQKILVKLGDSLSTSKPAKPLINAKKAKQIRQKSSVEQRSGNYAKIIFAVAVVLFFTVFYVLLSN